MAKGLFITGFTEQEVLEILSTAKKFLKEGKTLMQWTDNGTNSQKEFAMPVKDCLDECRLALQTINPKKYGRKRNCSVSGVSQWFYR